VNGSALPGPATALPWTGVALAVVGAIGFSGKAILAKLMYRYGVDAVTVVAWRMLLALPLFLLMAWWGGRGRAPLSRRDWGVIAGLGFTGYYLASMLDFYGLMYISASLERLILYLGPTIVMALSVWVLRKRVSARQWVAAAVSYAGVVLVFGHEVGVQGPQALLGAALVFGSAVSYSVYLLASGEVVQRLGALRLTGLASTVAGALCLLHFAAVRPLSALAVPEPVIGLSLLNATFSTVLPVWATMMAIERIGAALSSQIGLVGPLATIAMGVWLLGEPFTAWVAAGTVLVLAGITLLARWR
jgi:drug/metabolite transporter (DMT)-like permease